MVQLHLAYYEYKLVLEHIEDVYLNFLHQNVLDKGISIQISLLCRTP